MDGGWLSEVEIPIGRDDVRRSVDILIMVVPAKDLPDGASGRIAVTCSCDGTITGRVVFDVSVADNP